MTGRRDQLRDYVIDRLVDRAAEVGLADTEISGTFDFFESGLVDSLGLIRLLDEVEEHFGIEIDLAEVDPEHLTTLDGLVDALLPDE